MRRAAREARWGIKDDESIGITASDFLDDLTHSPTSENLTAPTIVLPHRRYIKPLSCRGYDDFRDIQPNIASQIQQTRADATPRILLKLLGLGSTSIKSTRRSPCRAISPAKFSETKLLPSPFRALVIMTMFFTPDEIALASPKL